MKLIRAEITGFGKYRQQQIDFHPQNQLLFGPNEIGKSTLYQFIQCLLFGFPQRRVRQKDYTPKDGTAFGGKLWVEFAGVGEVRIERYKQVDKGKAKVSIGEQVGGEKLLKDLLKGLTPTLFSEVFTFQQEQLSQLDHLQEDQLQQVLISLGITGSRQLMEQSQQYQKENQKLFRPKGSRLPLNELLSQWQQLNHRIQEKEAQEAQVQSLLAHHQQDQENLTSQRKEAQKLKSQLNQAKEQELHWQQYEEWQQLSTLEQTKQRLTGAQQRTLTSVSQQYQGLQAQLKQVDEDYHQAKTAETVTPQYEFYLQHEGVIKNLLKEQVSGVRLTDDFQRKLARQDQLLEEIQTLEGEYGWQVAVADQLSLSQLDQQMANLRKLDEEIQANYLQQKWLSTETTPDPENPEETVIKRPKVSLTAISFVLAGMFLLLGLILPKFKAFLGIFGILCGLLGAYWEYHRRQQAILQKTDVTKDPAFKQNNESQLAILVEKAAALQIKRNELVAAINQVLGSKLDLPITDSHSYQKNYQQYYQSLAELEQVTSDLQAQDEAYGALLKEFDFLVAWLPLQELDLVGRFESLQQFDQKMTRQKQLQSQQKTTLLAEQRKELANKITQITTDSQDLLQATAIESLAEIPNRLQLAQNQEQQARRLAELTEVLSPLYPENLDWDTLQRTIHNLESQLKDLAANETTLLEQVQRQSLELEALAKDGTLDELRQEATDLQEYLREQLVDWGARKVAWAALQDLATDLSEQQLPQLLKQAGHYLSILTNGRYEKLYFNEGQLALDDHNQGLSIQELSTGTKDQLIMAIRFGYLHLQKKNLCPVIIDDGWLHYDSQRKRQLAQLLAEFSKNYQVICLSSDQEMVSYYQDFQQPVQSLAAFN
ncbi:AAA family ATPase [Enterococcus asini]|uniref:ATP-binding protein n=1 Tax=Enterococcus asini TaxID=57732 RepID=UPI00288EBA58|nr:AAA family ATPase [Enterococcus asini]MDT2755791.1 AAA family ATPase [Enterococcus asini]